MLAPIEARAARNGWSFRILPELAGDVHDLDGLDAIGDGLAGSP
jgi:hypothetical protein